jgi:hypothetical protein
MHLARPACVVGVPAHGALLVLLCRVEAMELDTLTPDLPELLVEMGIKYDPDKLAAQLSSKWPQVSVQWLGSQRH